MLFFAVQFYVEDEDSDLTLSYAIGDYPGGTNVQGWTDLRGMALLVPTKVRHMVVAARSEDVVVVLMLCRL
jgi:hypothetical protein